ncbi:unnamed protein product [Candida verbasci]|uniref:Mitotic check point protein BFA1 n=1 Tax=Candida verbasci TaxID=1227364 RepID=A0A9W4XL42_9ASCO|nr:unnamed protein product [Candida verbasci]
MKSKNELLSQYKEEIFGDSEGMEFQNDVETLKINQLNLSNNNSPSFQITAKQQINSPTSKASSGKRITKETLSEYSDDTSLTDFISESEFEWGDQFNKNQNIYQQMNQKLIERKRAQQQQAEKELEQYETMRNKKLVDPNQTLKLKDFNKLTNQNLSFLDQLESEKTINYEYTKDDFDEFQDGFEDLDKKLHKSSLPSLNLHKSLKKFHSMNLSGPKYNDQVINKLNRIPSFYNKEKLEKYKENEVQHNHKSKIKNITKLSSPISSSKMRFDSKNLRWEGNEEDLYRFNKPNFISKNELNHVSKNQNMIFDNNTRKWININEEEDDELFNIPDLKISSPPKKSQSMRGLSQYTQRTTSTNSISEYESKDDFRLSSRLVDKFNKEELKIDKKISHWFQGAIEYKNDYYWEIRKMVMNE